MPNTTTQPLSAETLRRALEGADLEALVDLYTEDAEITSVDRNNTPGAPRILKGKDSIRAHFAESAAAT